MDEIQKLGKNLLYSLLFIMIGLFITALFSYFGVFKGKMVAICEFLIVFLAIFIGSYRQSKYGNKKGFIEILKIGLVFVILFMLINYILYSAFTLKNLLYYGLVILISVVGGLFGISKKVQEKK